jgi:hypothetical protein
VLLKAAKHLYRLSKMTGEVDLREVEMCIFLVNSSPLGGELAVVGVGDFLTVGAACLLQFQVSCPDALGLRCLDQLTDFFRRPMLQKHILIVVKATQGGFHGVEGDGVMRRISAVHVELAKFTGTQNYLLECGTLGV